MLPLGRIPSGMHRKIEEMVEMADDGDSGYGWVIGFTAFAAMMMLLIGFFQAAMGLVALFNQEFYTVTEEYVFKFDIGLWGWVHLVWGLIVIAAGFSVLSGAVWARVLGSALALISAIQAFLFLPYQPFWSIIIIAAAVMVIWALTTQVPLANEGDAATDV
jgi:hypothetical protein